MNLLTSPEHYSSRSSPCGEFSPPGDSKEQIVLNTWNLVDRPHNVFDDLIYNFNVAKTCDTLMTVCEDERKLHGYKTIHIAFGLEDFSLNFFVSFMYCSYLNEIRFKIRVELFLSFFYTLN